MEHCHAGCLPGWYGNAVPERRSRKYPGSESLLQCQFHTELPHLLRQVPCSRYGLSHTYPLLLAAEDDDGYWHLEPVPDAFLPDAHAFLPCQDGWHIRIQPVLRPEQQPDR